MIDLFFTIYIFRFCEQLYKSLGFDWFLLFLGGNIHKETVIRGVRMLCHMLSEPSSLNKFQLGAANGFWLIGSEALTSKKTNIAAGKCFCLLIKNKDKFLIFIFLYSRRYVLKKIYVKEALLLLYMSRFWNFEA